MARVYSMPATPKRATVYFDPQVRRAFRLKSTETEQAVFGIVNEAVRPALAEDAEDLDAFDKRSTEPRLPFAIVVEDLRLKGSIESSTQRST